MYSGVCSLKTRRFGRSILTACRVFVLEKFHLGGALETEKSYNAILGT